MTITQAIVPPKTYSILQVSKRKHTVISTTTSGCGNISHYTRGKLRQVNNEPMLETCISTYETIPLSYGDAMEALMLFIANKDNLIPESWLEANDVQ